MMSACRGGILSSRLHNCCGLVRSQQALIDLASKPDMLTPTWSRFCEFVGSDMSTDGVVFQFGRCCWGVEFLYGSDIVRSVYFAPLHQVVFIPPYNFWCPKKEKFSFHHDVQVPYSGNLTRTVDLRHLWQWIWIFIHFFYCCGGKYIIYVYLKQSDRAQDSFN